MLPPGKESYDKPRQHTQKQRHHFVDNSLYSQSYGFSSSHVQMWEMDHKEGCVQKNSCFQSVVCWRRLLWATWTARKSNQSILKEINSEYSLEGLMLKLSLRYFGHLMRKADSLEKNMMLGQMEGRMTRGQQMVGWHHWLNGHEFEQTPGDGERKGSLACCSPWDHQELAQLSDWTTTSSLNTMHGKFFPSMSLEF